MIGIGLFGMGYWGKNLFRTLLGNPSIQLTAVSGDTLTHARHIEAAYAAAHQRRPDGLAPTALPSSEETSRKMTLGFQELPT